MTPTRPLTPCGQAGCHTLVRSCRCARHVRKAFATSRHRGSPRAWRRLRLTILERDGWRCHRCGADGADEVDHVVSQARGGSDEPSNLRAIHRRCNLVKAGGEDAR